MESDCYHHSCSLSDGDLGPSLERHEPDTIDSADGYRAFRGNDPGIESLMRDAGFAQGASGRKTTIRPGGDGGECAAHDVNQARGVSRDLAFTTAWVNVRR